MDFKQLIENIEQTHVKLQQRAVSAINRSLTIRNWLIGLYIVEYEQNGEDRARYGEKLLSSIAKEMKSKKITGLAQRNLRSCRMFYQAYPQIGHSLSDLSGEIPIWQSLTAKSNTPSKSADKKDFGVEPQLLINRLSFTHIVELLRADTPLKRAFYEIQAIKGNWSVRELKRQMGSLLYERTGLSKDKEKLLQHTADKTTALAAEDIIRDPYIFEFLGLKQQEVMEESKLEGALLDHLQQFLLELGKGFCFEARQKRITVDNEHYYIDLVFYHRILKCHVIIDLKTKKFTHTDAGQLNFYLNYFKDQEVEEGDNPPVGILLCTEKDESSVKYATGSIDNQLFVSKYKAALPSEKELKTLIEKDLRLLGK